MYERQHALSPAQEHLKEFILKNKGSLEADGFLKDSYKYKPENQDDLPTSWKDFQLQGTLYLNTLHLLPESSIEDIIITVEEIHRILNLAQQEIEQVLNHESVKKLDLTEKTKEKLINDYLFIAQKPLVDALNDLLKIKNLSSIYTNQCMPPEKRRPLAEIVYRIKFSELETELAKELFSYKAMRTAEKESFKFRGVFSLFFNIENNFNRQDKLDAVNKLEERLKNKPTENFTEKELRALKDGRLGRIIEKYKKLGLPIETYTKNNKVSAVPGFNN